MMYNNLKAFTELVSYIFYLLIQQFLLMIFIQIIFRARRNHLLEKYTEEDNSPEKILKDVNSALEVCMVDNFYVL